MTREEQIEDAIMRSWLSHEHHTIQDLAHVGMAQIAANTVVALSPLGEPTEGMIEHCARIVEGDVYKQLYRTWPAIPSYIGNRSNDSDIVKHCDALAAALRALSLQDGTLDQRELRCLRAAIVDAGSYVALCPPPPEATGNLRIELLERRARIASAAALLAEDAISEGK